MFYNPIISVSTHTLGSAAARFNLLWKAHLQRRRHEFLSRPGVYAPLGDCEIYVLFEVALTAL